MERIVSILSQFRLFDAKRIKYKIGMINEKDFNTLKEKNQAIAYLIFSLFTLAFAREDRSHLYLYYITTTKLCNIKMK
jgi:hypothetical protein